MPSNACGTASHRIGADPAAQCGAGRSGHPSFRSGSEAERHTTAGPAFELRPYQSDLIRRTNAALRLAQRPLIVVPTGGGKSALIAELVRLNRATGRRSTVICHRREIALQLASAIGRHTGEAPEMVMAGSRPDWHAPVLLAMVPTLARRLGQIQQGGLLLVDEAHHLGSASWQRVKDAIAPDLMAGFTATPVRPDGRGLGEAGFDVLLEGPSPRWLMDEGFLCDYRLFASAVQIDTSGIRTRAGDFDTSQLQQRVIGLAGGIVQEWMRLNTTRLPTITVGVSVDHAKELAAAYISAGIPAAAVDGSMPTPHRDQIFKDFRGGTTAVLCACAVVDEGLDVPEAGCLQLVRPTKSLRLLRQLQGRVLRPSPGKDRALLIDHGPSWSLLPMPCEEIAWSLDSSCKAKRKGTPAQTERSESGQIQIIAIQQPEVTLKQINPATALAQRAENYSRQLRQVAYLARAGRIPEGAIWALLKRHNLWSLADLQLAGNVLGRRHGWSRQRFNDQNLKRTLRGLPPAPEGNPLNERLTPLELAQRLFA